MKQSAQDPHRHDHPWLSPCSEQVRGSGEGRLRQQRHLQHERQLSRWRNMAGGEARCGLDPQRWIGMVHQTLINNTAQNGASYFLTAAHCNATESNWVFYFNHETSGCTGSTGPTNQSVLRRHADRLRHHIGLSLGAVVIAGASELPAVLQRMGPFQQPGLSAVGHPPSVRRREEDLL